MSTYNLILICGILVSLLFTEITGLSAGLIVPGYIVLSLGSPIRIAYTLIIATAAAAAVNGLSNAMILYGRRRLGILIVITLALNGLLQLMPCLSAEFNIIGIIIPGLIAREMDRQGFLNAIVSIIIVSAATFLISLLCGYNPAI